MKPFLHAWGYYGLARDVVTPYAFAWHETRFPYRYRELPLHGPRSPFPSDAEDEPYALRAAHGDVAVVGRARRFPSFDNTFWDAFITVSNGAPGGGISPG